MGLPCNWSISTDCCSDWDTFTSTTRDIATTYASYILWAATGRQFGLCEQIVRPCGRYKGSSMPGWGWGARWDGGIWWPYIGADGLWRNCGCHGFCNCSARCEAYLPGPVHMVTEVIVDGNVVDPATYEVQDGHWLVRVGEGCWPECPSMEVDGAFEVTYLKGVAVPDVVQVAAGILACEFARACAGAECRLPGRLQVIARQGVTASNVDLDRLMDRNLTGIQEVDQVIAAVNPNIQHERPRVWSPDRRFPRTVTQAAGVSSS